MKSETLTIPIVIALLVVLGYFSLDIYSKQTTQMVSTVEQLLIEQQNSECESIAINLGHALYRFRDGREKAESLESCTHIKSESIKPWTICTSNERAYIHLLNNINEVVHIDVIGFYNDYLNKLIKGIEGSMWVMTIDGEVMIDNNKDLLGKNIFEVFNSKAFEEFRGVREELLKGKKVSNIFKYNWKNENNQIRHRILSYYRHNLMGREVVTCCSFDTESISNYLVKQTENSKQQGLVLFISFCFFIFFAVFFQLRRNKINNEKHNLSRFLSPKVVNEVLKNNLDLEAQISLRNVSIMMVDLRNFTKISNENNISVVIKFLSDFYSMCNEEIFKNEGTVDKYLGDSVMAVFGAPNDMDNYHEVAVRSSLSIIESFSDFKKRWKNKIKAEFLDIGISIASGEVITGPIGSTDKYDYTVIGSAVNLASRLEGLNKRYQTNLCICDQTWEHLRKKDDFNQQNGMEIRGFDEKKTVYFLKKKDS